jgi:hypothetical protein
MNSRLGSHERALADVELEAAGHDRPHRVRDGVNRRHGPKRQRQWQRFRDVAFPGNLEAGADKGMDPLVVEELPDNVQNGLKAAHVPAVHSTKERL